METLRDRPGWYREMLMREKWLEHIKNTPGHPKWAMEGGTAYFNYNPTCTCIECLSEGCNWRYELDEYFLHSRIRVGAANSLLFFLAQKTWPQEEISPSQITSCQGKCDVVAHVAMFFECLAMLVR